MSISRLQLRTNIHLCLKDVIDYASSNQDLKMVCFDIFLEGDGHKIGKEKSHEIVNFSAIFRLHWLNEDIFQAKHFYFAFLDRLSLLHFRDFLKLLNTR